MSRQGDQPPGRAPQPEDVQQGAFVPEAEGEPPVQSYALIGGVYNSQSSFVAIAFLYPGRIFLDCRVERFSPGTQVRPRDHYPVVTHTENLEHFQAAVRGQAEQGFTYERVRLRYLGRTPNDQGAGGSPASLG